MDGNAGSPTVSDDQVRDEATMLGPAGSAVLAVQSQQMVDSAKQVLTAAQSGGFGFQPEAADTMIAALLDSIAALERLNDDLIVISQAPKLGRTPGAQKVSPFTQLVATDGQGIVRMIGNFRQILTDLISAYQEAKRHYDETDTIAAQRMRRLHT
jgi:hypothetical protein